MKTEGETSKYFFVSFCYMEQTLTALLQHTRFATFSVDSNFFPIGATVLELEKTNNAVKDSLVILNWKEISKEQFDESRLVLDTPTNVEWMKTIKTLHESSKRDLKKADRIYSEIKLNLAELNTGLAAKYVQEQLNIRKG